MPEKTDSENLFELLDDWIEHGWLRPLDRAFASFLQEQQPDSPDLVLLAAVLTSHQLGRGHVCLDLKATLEHPDLTLSIPPETGSDECLCAKPSDILENLSPQKWENYLNDSALVASGHGNTPLVLDAGRLYLRRYWQYTQNVAQAILNKLQHKLPAPANLPQRLDRLFAPLRNPDQQAKTHVHWQSVAAAIATKSAFSVISGGPGTGKTTTVVHLLGLLQELAIENGRKLRIRLAAPTGKAAARLTESIGQAAGRLSEDLKDSILSQVTTLHRLLGSRPDTRHFIHNQQNPLHVDLLVVDEASMIDLEIMSALLQALPPKARLILIGDKDQLASVEAGSVLGDLCRNADRSEYLPDTCSWIEKNTGYCITCSSDNATELDQHIVVLQHNHRFGEKSGIGALARAVNAGDPEQVSEVWNNGFGDIAKVVLRSPDDKRFANLVLNGHYDHCDCPKTSACKPAGYRAYLERVRAGVQANSTENDWLQEVLNDLSRFQLLSPLRKGDWGVEKLNKKIAEVLFSAKLISATDGWYPGRPVIITRNDYSLGLMNGDTGVTLPVKVDHGSRKILKAVFPMPDGSLKKVLPSRLNHVETVYAMTVHKSQGSEFDHTALAFPDTTGPVLTRELIYTAITRSRSRFTLITSCAELMSKSVKRRVHRASGLADCF
ncbi:MAG: exodeoxyribonuclease V subunit alpha [Desulfobacteraceae bacterium]|nr:exodeoxyribonuclease V subunit alpha [Desulfobacteraceae bacterium]